MKKSCFTVSQIIVILKKAEAGTPAPELCRIQCEKRQAQWTSGPNR